MPDEPGVYLWRHNGQVAYVGMATSLRARAWSKHLGAGVSLSGSSLRRNVCELLFGIPPNVTGRPTKQKVTIEQAAAIRDWLLACVASSCPERLARVITSELGKPITESRGEVGGAADFCRLFASAIRVVGGEIMPSGSSTREIWMKREPIGVVAGIIPWNYPLALTARKVAPAIATGNAIVLKPSELTPLSALAFAELAIEAGVPQGILSVLPGPGRILGPAFLASPGVGFVTMTGSVRAGQSIIRNSAERVVPVSRELGGNAPFIVFQDADLEAAADAAVSMRMMNCGQACVCNERTYVHASVFDDFVGALVERVGRLVEGDPLQDATDLGPKASQRELDNVARLDDFDLDSASGIDRLLLAELGTCRYLETATNVLLIGPPGVGKTHLATGLGHAAVQAGYRTYFTSAADLAARCHRAAIEGKWGTIMRFFAGPTLLVIDELGYLPLPAEAASALFQVINQRYLKTSIVITTNRPVGAWGEILGDTTVAAAMLDRLLHRSVVITLDGASYRLRNHTAASDELRRITTGTNLR